MKRLPLLLLALSLLMVGPLAKAQVGIYATGGGAKLSDTWTYGPTFGIYRDSHHFPLINFGVDARVAIFNSNSNVKLYNGLIGPRAVVHLPIIPIKPYVEGLIGAGHITGNSLASKTTFSYGVAAGADLTFFPRLDWRVVDFTYGGFSSGNTNQTSISTGLVFRLPIP